MFIIQCDKCKKQSEPQRDTGSPDGWRNIEYRSEYRSGYCCIVYHICQSCSLELNLVGENKVSLADQFIDILSDLAANAVDDAIANS